MDASDIGAGGVCMSVSAEHPNTVWRVDWTIDISESVVSDSNPQGTITNYALEMAGILLLEYCTTYRISLSQGALWSSGF